MEGRRLLPAAAPQMKYQRTALRAPRVTAPVLWLAALVLIRLAVPDAWHVHAQNGAAPAGDVETVQIRPNVYVLFGAGGNITVHTGVDGAIVVDSGTAAMADAVLAAVQRLKSQPIRYVINTSADPDHVGGNAKLAAAGAAFNNNAQFIGAATAEVVAREEVLLRMSAPSGAQSPFPTAVWPTETFTQRVKSMYVNDDGVQIMHMPAAHSDGDSVVFFRRADVIATGDILDLRRFPMIDTERGGTVQGEIDALNSLLVLAIPPMPLVYREARTLLVPGHGRVADHAELVDYRDMVTVVRDIVEHAIKKGMSLPEIKASNPTAGFRAQYGSDTGPWTTEMFVEAVYNDLRGKRQ